MTEALATLIVVTFNCREWFPRLRAALDAQTERRWQLIVVDNASTAGQRPDAADMPAGAVLLQQEKNLGFASANNLAARGATTPYLILLNPDAFPEPEWLARLLSVAAQNPQAAAIGSTQVRADDPTSFDGVGDVLHASGIAYRSEYRRPRRALVPLAETFSACAAAMLIRREAFEAVGGFDERYFCFFEDVDLGFRLRLTGARVLQASEAVVAHVGGGSVGVQSPFAEFHGARNRLWTFVKCMPSPLFWLLLPAHLLASAGLATIALLRGRGFAAWRGTLAGVAGIAPIWNSRQEIQRARKASIAEIAGALTWSPDVFFTWRAVHRPPK